MTTSKEDDRGLSLFRQGVGVVVLLTVIDRLQVTRAFMSDEGVLPVAEWRTETESSKILQLLTVHAWNGSMYWQYFLACCQIVLSLLLAAGTFRPRLTAMISLWLYASATMCFVSSAFILDRYIIIELLLASCAFEHDIMWRFLWRVQLTWIYLDAGLVKLSQGGWSSAASTEELPALDAYLRHTFVAELLRKYLLSPKTLRLLTPVVPRLEVFGPCTAHAAHFLHAFYGRPCLLLQSIEIIAVGLIIAMHIGIGLGLNGAGFLSVAAILSWIPILPHLESTKKCVPQNSKRTALLGVVVLLGYAILCLVFGLQGRYECLEARASPIKTLFHNRFNVFAASDPSVTWEIMPAMLADGSVVDLWRYGKPVVWDMPRRAARPGRWRTFPMIGQDASQSELNRTYAYFCTEWNRQFSDSLNHPRRLLHFHAYMLRASVLDPANVSKRLLHAQQCS
mmetsp:Transcript_11986/g.17978  ORF Transcript_11986/g.17978 Transcript_11986/m.17978 type:complete len:452 (-) Transcript_11986:100-1455(-)